MKNFRLRQVKDPNVFPEYWDPDFQSRNKYFQLAGIITGNAEKPPLLPKSTFQRSNAFTEADEVKKSVDFLTNVEKITI